MSDIAKQITELSVEKRQLLERYLKTAGLNLSNAVIIPQRRDTNKFPLSFAQQRLWFLDQLEPNSPVYNIPDTHFFNGPLNLKALERSLSEIVRRHEVLRTTFHSINGEPVQVIAEAQPQQLEVIDLSDLPEEERQAKAERMAREETEQPFDLTRGPLFRFRLVRLAEEQHILLLTMHHIISDGWSLGVLGRELAALYQAYSTGQSSPLPELEIQYADFAVWQREWLQGEVLEKQLAYWREQLGGELPVLELTTDRPRPPVQTYRGKAVDLELSVEVRERLKQIGRENAATLFMTLMAAFNVLLWRYTQQEEILVGTPIANRNRAETESLIGFFVNTLVLRSKLDPHISFREFLAQVRETTVGAYGHQDVPFEKLVEELQPERSLNRQPLFQVLFTLQVAEEMKLGGLELNWMDTKSDVTKFDLSLFMTETETGLYSWFEYNTDLFDESTIARMLKHFHTLLEDIAANPDARLSELSLMTGEEREQIKAWNQTQIEYERDQCVHQLVELQAARRPDALAVVYGEKQISYGELNRRTNQLARYLRRHGVGLETRVGVLMQRSADWIVALLGILKAGGVYVPLDGSYPAQRLRFMVEDAEVKLLLTENGQPEIDAAEVVNLDQAWEQLATENAENLENVALAENLAYLMYTSGSTGQPKGVGVTHQAINRLVRNTNYVKFEESDRVAQTSNASFDVATFEIWGALLNGSRLVVLEKDTVLSPTELGRQLVDQQISVLFLTTALFHLMAQSRPEIFASLTYVIFGGDAADAQFVQRVLERGKPRHLVNGYGPTEGTSFTTSYEAQEKDIGARTTPIGRPLPNTDAWVLDRETQMVPVGVAGELHIGGDGLARGYIPRPGLTAEKFVPHPFSAEPGARLYRTGDLVRYQDDGNIEFLRRMDQQVKVRGFRVELGEIESSLNQYWAIVESVVIAGKDASGETRLIAYIVPEEGVEPTSSELWAFLQEKLPSYMLPSVFVTITELPLTPNGKVDRRALPVPAQIGDEVGTNFIPPRTDMEVMVAEIWRQTLGITQVGVGSNFFDLGGHSLLGTRVMSQIRENCGIELPLRVLFEAPTVAALARRLEEAQPKTTELGRILSMLENMENISEEEVTALLAQTEAGSK
ncbi:MAG TPA: amino acid adenylation domain-containing protein [Pyrinomonadaceae bacterium]|nr:amino acid adenylation domain-containing protein [Pyrinomonadaceae bacterium]